MYQRGDIRIRLHGKTDLPQIVAVPRGTFVGADAESVLDDVAFRDEFLGDARMDVFLPVFSGEGHPPAIRVEIE